MLEVRNIVKAYEGKPLLRGISFSVAQGETICLLGASGSGKSTLLRMIAGLEFPESGQFLFNQIDLAQTPPHARDFGLVFQDYGLFPHLNIFDNVAFGLKMRNLPVEKINSRVAEMMDMVNLQGFEKRKVTDLSGGEQQRVALARALAPSPRLLMFDEPLGALDKSLKEDLLNQIRAILHKTKIPAIYVTHDQDEAFTIADRILFLHDGEIIRDGTPDEVWTNPNSAWAARMLGMGNVIEGVITVAKKVKTDFGIFTLNCKHKHSQGEKISLLLKQSEEGIDEIKLKVEDVLFKQDQFQVKLKGRACHPLERCAEDRSNYPRESSGRMSRMKVLKKNLADEVTWQYEGVVLSREENSITLEALFNRDDMPFMGIVLKRNDRFVETFYSDRWYNIFEIYDRDDDRIKGWYCNIGKPAIIQDDLVSYVDLALDLWVSADGTQTVLDEDELDELNLDDELKRRVYDGLKELQTFLKTKNPPN